MRIFCIIGLLSISTYGFAKNDYTLSVQTESLAPNAGGQETWGLRLSVNDSSEYTVFANNYLRTGNYPLTGMLYDIRYSICGRSCFMRTFVQLGAGISTAGPVVATTWSINPLWVIRIDFSTHLYIIKNRAITWNYPLWVGFSIPF